MPCEPFGYVTHHYGNWVYAGNCWYWAPPVSLYVSRASYWYPGRVAWVSSSISIGWFPLAPYEMYYSNNYWGPWCRVRYYNHYYDCRKYRHYKHARYVDHHRFYGSKNYWHAGLRKGHNGEKFRGSARYPWKSEERILKLRNKTPVRIKHAQIQGQGKKDRCARGQTDQAGCRQQAKHQSV